MNASASQQRRVHDVIVAGGGPAGLSLAHALSRRGVDALLVDPRAGQPWSATWGVWLDEAETLGLEDVLRARVAAPRVRFAQDDEVALARGYGILDGEALRARLAVDVRALRASASGVAIDHVVLDDGSVMSARLVVDARGPTAVAGAAQTALGVVVRGRPPRAADALLMDFALEHSDPEGPAPPTFGYVVPLGNDRWLVEETALAAAPPVLEPLLARRLEQRLDALGVERKNIDEGAGREHVFIPLDVPLPGKSDRGALPIGVRGAAVHPATGYSIARTLGDAPRLANALVAALSSDGGAGALRAAGLAATWPPQRRRTHGLLALGRDVLLRLDLIGQRSFFRAFFQLPVESQRAFLSSDGGPADVALAMARIWPALPWNLRGLVSRTAIGRHPKAIGEAIAAVVR